MALGNWITTAGPGDALIAVEARSLEVALNTAVKNKMAMGHPVFLAMLAADEGLGPLVGSLGKGRTFLDIGQAKMASVAEGTEATASAITATSVTITPGRRAIARKASDWAVSLQAGQLRGEIAPDQYAMMLHDAIMGWGSDLVDRVVALATSATNAIGT